MEDAKHTKNLRWIVISLLLVGIIGCLVEMRAATFRQVSSPVQTLVGDEMTTAAITGGRSRGGSFDSPSAPSGFDRPLPRTAPSRPNYDTPFDYAPSYPRGGGSVVVPMPVPYPNYAPAPSYYDNTGGDAGISLIFLLLILGFMVMPIILNFIKLKSVNSPTTAGSAGELYNDVVTVTQVQVALLAQARTLQSELAELTLRSNPETKAGLNQMLQETVLMLLRSPEYWAYGKVSSQTLPSRDRAAQVFEQLSIQERSKYQTETLVNIGGQIHRQSPKLTQNLDSNAYIVVTLLVGTADDKPLVEAVHSSEELQAALRRLGSIPADYLLVYELIWSPQDESDSLTQDGLLAQYPDLMLLG